MNIHTDSRPEKRPRGSQSRRSIHRPTRSRKHSDQHGWLAPYPRQLLSSGCGEQSNTRMFTPRTTTNRPTRCAHRIRLWRGDSNTATRCADEYPSWRYPAWRPPQSDNGATVHGYRRCTGNVHLWRSRQRFVPRGLQLRNRPGSTWVKTRWFPPESHRSGGNLLLLQTEPGRFPSW